jgi:acetyl-CoA carboxylase biotin carboxyl carrier protein
VDLRKLKKLIDLVQESGVAELEVKEGEESVRITRAVGTSKRSTASGRHAPNDGTTPLRDPPARPAISAASEAVAPEIEGHIVKSPMVGTFYRSSTPGGKGLCRHRRIRSPKETCSALSKR